MGFGPEELKTMISGSHANRQESEMEQPARAGIGPLLDSSGSATVGTKKITTFGDLAFSNS
jgi:hypothetical protein